MPGDRLLASEKILNNVRQELECNNNDTGLIYSMYCGGDKTPENNPDCKYFDENDARVIPGIPGLASGVFVSKC